jgi:hypothetical protein
MNELLVPRIINRFPGKRQLIIDLCTSDMVVSELCEDYEKLIDTLVEAGVDVNSKQIPVPETSSLYELFILKKELEQELLDRLERQQRKSPKQAYN